MIVQHNELAAGRWEELRLIEQMAHVGSEVERALNWKAKNNLARSAKAFDRALELLDMTPDCPRNRPCLKEIARAREVCVDFFRGENQFASSENSLRKYFLQFARAARREFKQRRRHRVHSRSVHWHCGNSNCAETHELNCARPCTIQKAAGQ